MADKADTCSGSLSNVFPVPTENGEKKYRFFTLPIEQIPGHKEGESQILVHRPNCGLQWFTLDLCLPVVTCVKLESNDLVAERRSIIVIKDSEIDDCIVEINECTEQTP